MSRRTAAGLGAAICLAPALLAGAPPKPTAPPVPHAAAAGHGCLPGGNGYLRARIRGALTLDIDFADASLECDGGARPDRHGIRVSFAGPLHSDGRRLRMVFGVASTTEGAAGTALPTNLTVIFEGEERLFATRGEERCTIDRLTQERIGPLAGSVRSWRVIARGFCTQPASSADQRERIVVTSFDFAGRVTFSGPDDARTAAP